MTCLQRTNKYSESCRVYFSIFLFFFSLIARTRFAFVFLFSSDGNQRYDSTILGSLNNARRGETNKRESNSKQRRHARVGKLCSVITCPTCRNFFLEDRTILQDLIKVAKRTRTNSRASRNRGITARIPCCARRAKLLLLV